MPDELTEHQRRRCEIRQFPQRLSECRALSRTESYQLVRIFFCGVSLFFLTRPAGVRDWEKWLLTGLAVLYNPLVPVELGDKTLWIIVNVATVAYFWVLNRRATSARRW